MTMKEARMSNHELSADGRAHRLYDGNWMPMLGFGVWQIPNGRECEDAVRWALEAGYRHIDTAQAYGNEDSVGRALRDSEIAREEVFVTTKFRPASTDPAMELERSLTRLGLDYVDLYLIHWPAGGPTWAWPGMHACRQAGVVLEAYSPLGHGRHLSQEVVGRIAQRLGRTPAQALLRWCVEQQVPLLAKSTHRSRIEENADIFDFELSDRDRDELAALDRTSGTAVALERKWW
jgi:diketogulonate reductase-like aldo/keto reductase